MLSKIVAPENNSNCINSQPFEYIVSVNMFHIIHYKILSFFCEMKRN